MSEVERIAMVGLADDLQVRKQRIFKTLPRLGIRPTQRRDPSRGNPNVATLSQAEARAVRSEIEKPLGSAGTSNTGPGNFSQFAADDGGFFYLIQLEPEHDAGRFNLGFTTDLDGRLQKHRCSAATDCLTNGCEQLHTEVFRATSLDRVIVRAQAFFAMMPNLEAVVEIAPEGEGENNETKSLQSSALSGVEDQEAR